MKAGGCCSGAIIVPGCPCVGSDTPSTCIALAILYKLLIINLLPFASITSDNVGSGAV
jgi:hypothetical protein